MAMALAAAGVLYVGLALLLDTRCCGTFSPCPLAPCPPLGGGGTEVRQLLDGVFHMHPS